jgi:hypothetical protein
MSRTPYIVSERALSILTSAWSDSTLKTYKEGIEAFRRWCDISGIPEGDRLPTQEALVCNFIADSAGRISGSSLRNYLSGLKVLHIYHGLPFPHSDRIKYLMKAAMDLTPESSRKGPRAPVTLMDLELLGENLSPSSPLDCAVLAAATTAFWCQARLGELLPNSRSAQALQFTPRCVHLDTPSTAKGSRRLHLPWTKTTRWQGGTIIICQLDRCDLIHAMESHLSINNPPADCHLFSFRQDGALKTLTKRLFLQCCNKVWNRVGLRHSGHGFRIGGTTELLLRGIAPHVVQALGRWSSDAFLRYWRNIDLLAEIHLSMANPPPQRMPSVCPPTVGVCPSPGLTSGPSGTHSGGFPHSAHPAVGLDRSSGIRQAVRDPDSPEIWRDGSDPDSPCSDS